MNSSTHETPRYDTQNRRLCGAHRSNGESCHAPAMAGQRVCYRHGGASPQARQAARLRLMDLVDPAITRLAQLVANTEDERVLLDAINSVLDRTGYAKGYELTTDDARALLAERLTGHTTDN